MLKFFKRIFGGRAPEPPTGPGPMRAALGGKERAETGLRHSEERFRLLVESVKDYAIFMLDPQGLIATWNVGAMRLKGYAAEEILGQHFSRFYTKEDVESGKPGRELEIAATTGRCEDEGWRIRKDGTRFWANVVITALRNEGGVLLGFGKVTRDMTERKEAEEKTRRLLQEEAARQASEASALEARQAHQEERRHREQLHVTLTSIGDAVIVTDMSGVVTFLNPVAQALTGWQPQEAAGQPLGRVFPIINEESRLPSENPVIKVLREGQVIGLANHTLLIARDGREIPIDDSAAPIRGEDGTIAGVVLVFRDVREARRAAKALREGEARKTAILETALDCIITMDDQGRVVEFNPAAEQTFGYRRAEVLGRPLAELIVPPQLREQHQRGLAHYFATGEGPVLNRRIEIPAMRADGTVFPVELAITRLPIDGPPVFTGFIRDLSDRKRVERRRAARLAVTQILAEAATIHDAAHHILAAVCERLGWDVGAFWLVDRPAQILRCAEVWHTATVPAAAFKAAQQQMTFASSVGLPGRIWAGGRPAWIPDLEEDSNFPRKPEALRAGLHGAFGFPVLLDKEVLGVVEFFSHEVREPDEDLLEMVGTIGAQIGLFIERRRAEEQLAQQNEELAAADRQKNEWIAMLAHELRNPLAPIRNALHIMKMPGATNEAVEQARQMTERQVQHMVRLVDDLLDVSRIMRGRIELRKEPVDLASVVARGAETAQPEIDAQGQQLIISIPPEPLLLEGDPTRLAQVVFNLLHNAAKFSDRSGRIWLTAERQGAGATLRVRDEGAGIPADLLPHIFDLFIQGDRSMERSQGGLGIGLTVVRKLVELHGGIITAHSEGPGKGAEFVVRLPGVLEGLEGHRQEPTEASPRPAQASIARRILVVDDNLDAAESVAMLLGMSGHDVRLAHNGLEALQAAELFQPEVVMLDIGLPGMNGYEVARYLRQHPKFRETLLIAVTGYGQEEDRRRSLDAGFDQHLVKPVDPHALQQVLATLK
jgi:PAS domain S-box-containing protein